MNIDRIVRSALAGLAGGFAGNALLGVLFTSGPIRSVLYDPDLQSELFLSVTPQRDVAYSVAGLVLLSAAHGLLFEQLSPSLPGRTWLSKGAAWGGVIWLMYWVFQEWFVYHTLLREPALLAGLELAILFLGSLVEGLTIAALLSRRGRASAGAASEQL